MITVKTRLWIRRFDQNVTLPLTMFFQMILTYLSRSERPCSWNIPSAWPRQSTKQYVKSYHLGLQKEAIVFIFLQIFLQRAGINVTNCLPSASWVFTLLVISDSTLWTNKHVPSSVTTPITFSSWIFSSVSTEEYSVTWYVRPVTRKQKYLMK